MKIPKKPKVTSFKWLYLGNHSIDCHDNFTAFLKKISLAAIEDDFFGGNSLLVSLRTY